LIDKEERLQCSSDVRVIEDDLRVKREKEMTICYGCHENDQSGYPVLSNVKVTNTNNRGSLMTVRKIIDTMPHLLKLF